MIMRFGMLKPAVRQATLNSLISSCSGKHRSLADTDLERALGFQAEADAGVDGERRAPFSPLVMNAEASRSAASCCSR